jgi:hypothetical protein
MKLQELKTIAKTMGIKTGRLNKRDLVRTIQKAEGNFYCYGSATSNFCDRNNCLWKNDCMAVSVH